MVSGGFDHLDEDAARVRLEDVLLALPYDRALPELRDLLERAGVPQELLHRDERVLKVLHEAILARPLGQPDEVARIRVEVELLTLEADVLRERFDDPGTAVDDLSSARARLDEIRARLDELHDQL